jgi:hypothetical protein
MSKKRKTVQNQVYSTAYQIDRNVNVSVSIFMIFYFCSNPKNRLRPLKGLPQDLKSLGNLKMKLIFGEMEIQMK